MRTGRGLQRAATAAMAIVGWIAFGSCFVFGQGSTAADFLLGGPCRFAFVESRQERAFVQRAEAIGLRYTPGPHIEGFNINGNISYRIVPK